MSPVAKFLNVTNNLPGGVIASQKLKFFFSFFYIDDIFFQILKIFTRSCEISKYNIITRNQLVQILLYFLTIEIQLSSPI